MITWGFFGVRLILALATVGVGVAVVRPVHARSGMLLAAAGGLELVTSCLVRAMVMLVVPYVEMGMAFQAVSLAGTLAHVVYVGLIIAALLGLAKAVAD